MNLEIIFSILGWSGTVIYLANHTYISVKADWRKWIYFGGNLIAATFLLIQSTYLASWQAVVINAFWMLISMCLLAGISFERIYVNAKYYYVLCAVLFSSLCITGLFIDFVHLAQLFAWSSAFVFCSCYFLFSAKRISSRAYLTFNIYAALVLLPQLYFTSNWPAFGLEVAWAAISTYGVIKSYQNVHLID
ncbi:CBU_0592 family membrane protein [Glaciecola petra]|uniref:CBU-0592-like domain-containing protein n=1 Tax=Glaciecola petra TaxID=3075602 RepID=A0ABU2ZP24_9ALTE|nr:hypothetical protein [Aestuariibacter sp. P117]MDT0594372.1 hypothetical protein [Aestuariibacter sp. P117]